MGQDFKECWFSAWPVIGEAFERASRGETSFLVNQRMFLDRLGYLEETFFTFSFSPIRDESGGVGGLFHPVTELTQQSLAERRLRVLRNLADGCAEAESIERTLVLIGDTLEGCDLDVPFALIYCMENDGKSARLVRSVGPAPGALSPQQVSLDPLCEEVWPFPKVLMANPVVVNDLTPLFESGPTGPYAEPPGSAVVQHIMLPGMVHPFGFLVAGVSSRRPLDDPYRTFYDMLGEAVTNALGKARAFEGECKRAEALAELDRVKTAFFSNVSHEFRTPLTLMLGPLEELLTQGHTDLSPAAKSQLEVINRNGLRLLRLVNSLLDFSRIEAGRVQASYEPTDLAAFTTDLASSFRSATERAGLRLIVNCQILPEPVYVDKDMWEKIVLNLISNAFKFTFNGEITVTMQQIGQLAELRVGDTGVGISMEHLPRIFDRFHRVENIRSRTHEGSGIGLALVQELVKLHGGTVRAESTLNAGSTFIVTIPLGTEHLPSERIGANRAFLASTGTGTAPFVEEALRWLPSQEGAEQTDIRAEEELSGAPTEFNSGLSTQDPERRQAHTRILLVDDNADMRDYLARILSVRYEVTAVRDGEAAIAAIHERHFHLVLSDVMMPGLDGIGLLRRLRNDPATRTIPVILLSAHVGEESRVEGLEQGADDYLFKPFSARELLARVDAHVKLQQMRWDAQAETQKFVSLAENSSEFIGMCDRQFRPFYINPTGMAMVGIDNMVEAQQVSVKDFFFQEDQSFVLDEIFPRVMREGRAEVEIRFRHFKTGEAVWMIWNVFYLSAPDGSPIGLATVSRNITERKRTEEALRESEAQFRILTDSMPQQVWTALPDGSLDYINQRALRYFSRASNQILGWNWKDVLHPDDVEHAMAVWANAREHQIPYEIQFRLRRAEDGRYRWHLGRALPLLDTAGHILKWFGTNTDITEAKQVEAALRKSEKRFRQVFQYAATGIALTNMNGLFIQCNPAYCALLGYSEKELGGLNFSSLVHPDDREANLLEIQRLIAQELPYFEIENRYLRKDGQAVWVQKFVSLLRDESGEPAHLEALVTDITGRKEAEEQLRRWKDELEMRVQERTAELLSSQERLRSLASQLSLTEQRERRKLARDLHDYLAQLLVLGRMKLEQGKPMLSAIPATERMVQDVDHILEQALSYSRTLIAELSQPALQGAGFSESLRWLADQMQTHGLIVQVHTDHNESQLPEDRAVLLFQSVRELLFNVLKHSGVDQAIVRMEFEQKGEVCLSVEDQGKGLGADVLQRALEPGHLGLFAVKERMDAMGGRVELISSPHTGTTVKLMLPVCSTRPASSEKDIPGEESSGTSAPPSHNPPAISIFDTHSPLAIRPIRILLVDDHVMVRKGLLALLESYDNLEIIGEAGDGEEAVVLAGELRPDVVIMDLNLRNLNGIEATRQITRHLPDIKVIGLSFNDAKEMREAMIEAGAVDLLRKTGGTAELYQAICAACPNR
ncbi:MAG: PAS domain S-box protein [Nitrospirales bacterium]